MKLNLFGFGNKNTQQKQQNVVLTTFPSSSVGPVGQTPSQVQYVPPTSERPPFFTGEFDYQVYSSMEFPQLEILKPFLVEEQSFVAGGCFKNLLTDTPVKDIDVYFYEEEYFDEALEVFSNSPEYEEVKEIRPAGRENRSVKMLHKSSGIMVDLIQKDFDIPASILEGFDITVTQCAMVAQHDKIYLLYDTNFFNDVEKKILRLTGEHDNCDILLDRVLKYSSYGYKLDDVSRSFLLETLKRDGGKTTTTTADWSS